MGGWVSRNGESTGHGVWPTQIITRLHHFLPMSPVVFLPLSLNFLICKLGFFMSCVTQGLLKIFSEITCGMICGPFLGSELWG